MSLTLIRQPVLVARRTPSGSRPESATATVAVQIYEGFPKIRGAFIGGCRGSMGVYRGI